MKIDISSTAIEKGLDLAKEFLGKLISPTVEEVGLLLKDHVTFWKLKHQIQVLNKTKEYCLRQNISIKSISLKLLCPLLENAALEEDGYLQDKLAILLGNMVDSDQNIENHVFPFLLSQISKTEFLVLEKVFSLKEDRSNRFKTALGEYNTSKSERESFLISEIKNFGDTKDNWELTSLKYNLESEQKEIQRERQKLMRRINELEPIPSSMLKEFELSNLIRLGIAKSIQQNYAYSNSYKIINDPKAEYLYIDDLEILVDPDGETYVMSELGELFLKACSEKT